MATTESPDAWTARDSIAALGWFALALLARSVMVSRIEGVIEHDQAIVGLMALDIAEGRRLPIFFDGQRYMGALEAYTAAIFVKLFGHSPASVAMAPTLYFAWLVAGQFVAWRAWKGRTCGHLAALFTLACSPMMAIWSVIPRGGYTEVLAWGLATMVVYRRVTRSDQPPIGRLAQLGWGVLFTFGYFLNPLSLVVYVTLAIDWTFGRHGQDIRRERGLTWRWPDRRWAGLAWAGLAAGILAVVAVGCHVLTATDNKPRYVFLLDLIPGQAGAAVGVAVVLATLALSAWWTGLARRVVSSLSTHPAFALGALIGLGPFLIYTARVRLGLSPLDRSLPVWVRPPWAVGPNVLDGLAAVGPLFGGQVRGGNVPYLCLPLFRLPEIAWPGVAYGLRLLTPVVATLLVVMPIAAARSDREAWREFWALRGASPTRPTVLATIGLGSCVGLYLLQASSPDGSSIRYLLPAWLFLPGLLASALLTWPRAARAAAAGLLLGVWILGQASLVAEMDRPVAERRLADRLEAEGVRGIVASGALVQVVADLSHGHVGGIEFRSHWPRLGRRYADRFDPAGPIVCVVDRAKLSADDEPGSLVDEFVASHPWRARLVAEVENYQVWRLDTTLDEFLAEPGDPLPVGGDSAIVSR
ncbi:MAG TPA: hypothetical protein VGH33_24955 [Isosphaeraceae bacterium]